VRWGVGNSVKKIKKNVLFLKKARPPQKNPKNRKSKGKKKKKKKQVDQSRRPFPSPESSDLQSAFTAA
jgi:hypothetical protein